MFIPLQISYKDLTYLIKRRVIALRDHGVKMASHARITMKTCGLSGTPNVNVRINDATDVSGSVHASHCK